jgi:hypothetical protein
MSEGTMRIGGGSGAGIVPGYYASGSVGLAPSAQNMQYPDPQNSPIYGETGDSYSSSSQQDTFDPTGPW